MPADWHVACLTEGMRPNFKQLIGRALNLFGLPGFARTGSFQAPISGVVVKVSHSDLFTVITVDGVDVYLNRITGEISGVGFNATDPSRAGFLELTKSAGLRGILHAAAQKGRVHPSV